MAKNKLTEVTNSYYNAHEVIKGNVDCDATNLDDVRAKEEKIYRARRVAEEAAKQEEREAKLATEEEEVEDFEEAKAAKIKAEEEEAAAAKKAAEESGKTGDE